MIIVKLRGKSYDPSRLEENSKIVRKWFVIKQIRKEQLHGKYHVIEDCEEVIESYNQIINTVSTETKSFYDTYLNETWKETYPIMKDVSSFEKIRPCDGTEFCMLI